MLIVAQSRLLKLVVFEKILNGDFKG